MYALSQSEAMSPVMREAIAALPSCYTEQLHACVRYDNENGLPKSQCDAIKAAYDEDWDEIEARVKAIPFCPHPKRDRTTMVLIGAGGVVVGVVLGALLRKRR